MASALAFGICLWLVMAVDLPGLPTKEADRWVVAAAFATIGATALLTWGAWWAGRENRPEGAAGQQISGSPGSLQFGHGARVKNITLNPPPVSPAGEDEVGNPKA